MILLEFFSEPEKCEHFSLSDWEELFCLARVGKLLARVSGKLREKNLESFVPEDAKWLLDSAWTKYERGRRQILWEINRIQHALENAPPLEGHPDDIPLVLLKGAAYQAAGMAWGAGRMSVDVDVMVPLAELNRTEVALHRAGWFASQKSEYDEHFYRDWMHEIPPMTHIERGTTLDVHHTILPRTGRVTVDAARLFEKIHHLSGNTYILAPTDMLLHSAVHTFQDGELSGCFRDFLDLDAMFREFGQDEEFWSVLPERAEELGVCRPLFYASRYCRRLLGTPLPEEFLKRTSKFAGAGWMTALMDFCVPRSVLPEMPGEERQVARLARFLLYVRSHFLRMPLHMLLPHLWKKWWVRRAERRAEKCETEVET